MAVGMRVGTAASAVQPSAARRVEFKPDCYANASIVGSDRVVFNVKGNAYRLIVAVDYQRQIVFIKWLGAHIQYDKIDVKKVKYGD